MIIPMGYQGEPKGCPMCNPDVIMTPAEIQSLTTDFMSKRQKALAVLHGTPSKFASACYDAVPGDISMDEAVAAIEKYNKEWADAS